MVGKVTTIQKMSASRLPAIMGYSPYQTPNDELDTTIRARKEGVDHYDIQVGEAADWGNDLEDIILRRAADKLGLQKLRLDYPDAYNYKDLLQASLDGGAWADQLQIVTDPVNNIYVMNQEGSCVLDGPGVLESKLTRVAPSDTPAAFRGPIQLQGQMLCTGATWGIIATLYQGVELYIYVYKANQEMQEKIIAACSDFERRVRDEDYYPALHATEAAAMKGDVPEDVEIEADEELQEMISKLAHLRTELKAYQALEQDLQLDIMNRMGDANIAHAGQYRITWPLRKVKAKPAQVKEIPAVEEHWARAKTLKLEDVQ